MLTMKKTMAMLLAISMLLLVFAGCNATGTGSSTDSAEQQSETSPLPEQPPSEGKEEQESGKEKTTVRIGTLKGPTGMGMVGLMQSTETGTSENDYIFEIKGAPEDVRAMLISGEVDIAALPTNMASVLYNQDNGSVRILAVNTLGVLYVLDKDQSVHSAADLKGKTLYATGKGAAPEYVLNYVLEKNNLTPGTDVAIEYRSEHSELASLMVAGDVTLGMLPEPFVATTMAKDESIAVALDLTEEWNAVTGGASLAMGCIVVRTGFAEENPEAIEAFLMSYQESVTFVNRDIGDAADLMGKFDIIAPDIAEKAIPNCNIVYMDGEDMKKSVESFLNVLYEADPKAVGGSVPDDAFYYGI